MFKAKIIVPAEAAASSEPTASPAVATGPTDYQKRFSQVRKEGHFTLKQVADELEVSVPAISQFELGKSSISLVNFLKACEVMGVRTEWVLHGTGRVWTRSKPLAEPVRKRAAARTTAPAAGQ